MSIIRITLTATRLPAVAGCAADAARPMASAPVRLIDRGANAVSLWHERGAATISLEVGAEARRHRSHVPRCRARRSAKHRWRRPFPRATHRWAI